MRHPRHLSAADGWHIRPRAHAQFLQVDEAAEAGREAATELVVEEVAAAAHAKPHQRRAVQVPCNRRSRRTHMPVSEVRLPKLLGMEPVKAFLQRLLNAIAD